MLILRFFFGDREDSARFRHILKQVFCISRSRFDRLSFPSPSVCLLVDYAAFDDVEVFGFRTEFLDTFDELLSGRFAEGKEVRAGNLYVVFADCGPQWVVDFRHHP